MKSWTRRIALVVAMLAVAAAGCERGGRRGGAAEAENGITIVLDEYRGPDAVASARRVERELEEQGLEDVFVVEGENKATLCYGHFESVEPSEIRPSLQLVRSIRDEQGRRPFYGALPMPIPEPTPRTRWELTETDGDFSLHVASFDGPGRKAKAQDYAEKLRRKDYEAYVHHGPRLSMVTLGSFTADIFKYPQLITVAGHEPKVVDPGVKKLQKEFPYLLLADAQGREMTELPTSVIIIPGRQLDVNTFKRQRVYRVALTSAGPKGRRRNVQGVAQSATSLPYTVAGLARQLLTGIQPDEKVRLGVVAVVPRNQEAVDDRADVLTYESLRQYIEKRSSWVAVDVLSPTETGRILADAGVDYDAILEDPHKLAAIPRLDMIVLGTVTAIPATAIDRPGAAVGGAP